MDLSIAGVGDLVAARQPRADAAAPKGEPTDPRLLDAAMDFEAMLLESWWKSMKATFGEEDGEAGSEALDDLSIEAMSTAIASGGGLGLARLLLGQLQAESAVSEDAQVGPDGATG